MKNQKIQVIRRISQVIALLFFAGIFSLAFSGFEQLYTAAISGNFHLSNFNMVLFPMLLVVGLSIFAGRFFCGWFCAFGALNDFLYILSKKLFPKKRFHVPEALDKRLKYLKYIILGLIVIGGWTLKVLPEEKLNPWAAFAQFGTLFKGGWSLAFLILFLIMAGAMLVERFFCRYLCPLGAILAVIGKIPVTAITKLQNNCHPCRLCSVSCPMGMDLTSDAAITGGECIRCLKCIDVCPKTNRSINIFARSFNTVTYLIAAFIIFTGINLFPNFLGDNPVETGVKQLDTAYTGQKVNQRAAAPKESYRDGVYEGEANGFRPGLRVKATVKNGKIADIEIVASNDDPPFIGRPAQVIPEQIIETQSTDVDAVSGATFSSQGIINAVKDALSKANTNVTVSESTPAVVRQSTQPQKAALVSDTAVTVKKSSNKIYRDGTFQGEAVGFRPGLKVSITVKSDKIMDVEIIESNDDRKFSDYPFQVIPAAIVAKQTADVDAVSGATYTSRGIMDAVKDALRQAAIPTTEQGA